MRCLTRMVAFSLAAGLLLGCGAEKSPTTGSTGSPASVSPSATSTATPTADRTAELRETALTAAEAAGETPTGVGISDVVHDGASATFFWETSRRRLCLAEVGTSGGYNHRRCADPSGVAPKAGAHLAPVFGPGTASEGWMVVLLAEPGSRMTSARFGGKDVEWTFVRNLAPEMKGRGVYYVALAELPVGELEMTVEVDGRRKVERLTFS